MTLLERVRHLLGFDQAPSTAIAVRAALPHASGLDRRQFLTRVITGIAGAAAASTLDLEQLLWMPGEKTILIPELVGPEALNTFVTVDWIVLEALRLLKNNLTFANAINRDLEASDAMRVSVRANGLRLGDTVQIADAPSRFVVDPTLGVLGHVRRQESVLLTDGYRIELDADTVRSIGDRRQRRAISRQLEPKVAVLAQEIRRRHLNVFGKLALPDHGVMSASVWADRDSGLSLRGVQMYDVLEGRNRFALDFLGGHSRLLKRKVGQL